MGYYIDLTRISLDTLRERLKKDELLPSQQILKEDTDERFKIIKAQNLKTVEELKQALKTKDDVNRFSFTAELPENFLTVLRREINGLHPQPRKLSDFPSLSDSLKRKLQKSGIRTTLDLYDRIASKDKRDELKNEMDISRDDALLLTKLTDLSRIRYVNQAFATLLTNSAYDTVEKIKKADCLELHRELVELNKGNLYKLKGIGN